MKSENLKVILPASRKRLLFSFLFLVMAIHQSAAAESKKSDARQTDGAGKKQAVFRFAPVTDKSLGLWEGEKPVFVYNHGVMSKEGVPEDRKRSSYLHPVYGLEGEVLTDDFPKDHYHHRGVFWSWPHVVIGGKRHDLWELRGIEHKFEYWLARQGTDTGAVLGVENGWFAGGRKVMAERLWIRTYNCEEKGRMIDLEFFWIPIDQEVTLRGAEGKSYGGLTMRFAPCTNVVITTPVGNGVEDLHVTRLPWADFTGKFGKSSKSSGAAIFISPDHPDYPPEWLTRHYGVLCVGWPGVKEKTFKPEQVIHARYRLWIHGDGIATEELAQEYNKYVAAEKVRCREK